MHIVPKNPNPNKRVWFFEQSDHVKTVDGDTFDVRVLLTPTLAILVRVRIRGLWCPELNDKDDFKRDRAQKAAIALNNALKAQNIQLAYHGLDMYGRWVCDVATDDIDDVAAWMVEIGLGDRKRTNHTRHTMEALVTGFGDIDSRTFDTEEEQF